MFETVQQLLRSRMDDDTVAVKYGDRTWTWREHLAEAAPRRRRSSRIADPARPLHVGALLGNTPDMLRRWRPPALGGYVLCGINTTRRGDGLARDIARSDCQILLTDAEHRHCSTASTCPACTVLDVDGAGVARRCAPARTA